MGMNMDQMMGFLGDRILVNGRPDFVLPVATRPYRLRFLNGSNSRIYKLGWSDGTPLTVIATDGGLLAKPVQRPYVMLAPPSASSCGLTSASGRWAASSRCRAWSSSASIATGCPAGRAVAWAAWA